MANVLALVSYKVFPPRFGGQKTVVGLYNELSLHHNIILAVSGDNEIVETNYPIKRVLFRNRWMIGNIAKIFYLQKICRGQNIECLIAEHSYTGWIAYLVRKLTGVPFIIRSHNIESSRFRQMGRSFWRLYHLYEKWIHRKADHSFFISAEDELIAIRDFGLPPLNCSVIPYGIANKKTIENPRAKLKEKYGVDSTHIFYFNGTLDYSPNTIAISNLLEKVNPLLQSKSLDFTILISGKNLPVDLIKKIDEAGNMKYLGFVEDVDILYQSATAFLNPVINNSGVKTKVIEAIANNCSVVSMLDGAHGIPDKVYGGKMLKAKNDDWEDFVEKTVSFLNSPNVDTPKAFFDYFSSKEIAQKAADKIKSLVHANARQ